VVFFTNQAGIEKLKTKPEDIMKKVEDMIAELAIPVLVRDRENLVHAH
jgi:bifunctional polynucleotide phosphatase/kinase